MLASTTRALVLTTALLNACTDSHSPDPCPEVIGTCVDECCESFGRPTFDAACNATCPSGTSLIDRCAPAASCGCPDRPLEDAGAIECRGGACCTDLATPIPSADCSSFSCPAGYSLSCVPDPAADCAPPWLPCDANSDCQLAPIDSCCFPCGVPELADVRGINASGATQYFESLCPGGAACPECLTAENPDLRATCGGGFCEALDVRALPLSGCTNDADCVLRVTDCCECGGNTSPEALIAIRADAQASYVAIACDPMQACDFCAPSYPTSVEAFCATDGHCDIRPVP